MAVEATKALLQGIAEFRNAYGTDKRFAQVISELNAVEQEAEKLVPAAGDKTPDAADSPGRKAAKQAAAENAANPAEVKGETRETVEPADQPKDYAGAREQARGMRSPA